MKQFLLFVSLAGAALYALLVFTHDAITDGKSELSPFLKLNRFIQSLNA